MTRRRRRTGLDLQGLERLQARFDAERGFDFPELESGRNVQLDFERLLSPREQFREAVLRRIEFTTMALSGEVGELSNFVKKSRRAAWRGEEMAKYLESASQEAADILAYLLKLAHLMNWDLHRLYLEKLAENCLRFPRIDGISEGHLLTIVGATRQIRTKVAEALADSLRTTLSLDVHAVVLTERGSTETGLDLVDVFEEVEASLLAVSPSANVIVSEDPAFLVRVTGRSRMVDGTVSDALYEDLLLRLIDLESYLGRWNGGRAVILLEVEGLSTTDGAQGVSTSEDVRVSEAVDRFAETITKKVVLPIPETGVLGDAARPIIEALVLRNN